MSYRNNKGQFTEGIIPWNKGTKGLSVGGVVTQFKKGNLPHNTKYDGCIVQKKDKSGLTYKYIRTDLNKWEPLHRYNWEQANGPIPKNTILRSINGDTLNCDPSNWQLITRAEHLRLNNKNNTTNLIALDKQRAGVRLNNNNNNNQKITNMSILKQLSQAISSLIDQLDEQDLKLKAYELQLADLKNEIITLTSKAAVIKVYDYSPALKKEDVKPIIKEKDAYKIYEELYDKQKSSELKPYHNTCAICNHTFVTYNKRQIYCSPTCKKTGKLIKTKESLMRHKKITPPKKCSVCGKEFSGHSNQTVCSSVDCREVKKHRDRHQYYINIEKKNNSFEKKYCVICNAKYLPNRKDSATCSKECAAKYSSLGTQRRNLKVNPATPLVLEPLHNEIQNTVVKDIECASCGALFASKNNEKYCSPYCADHPFPRTPQQPQKNTTFTKPCQICGEFFDTSDINHTNCPSCHKLSLSQRKAKYKESQDRCEYKVFANDKPRQII